MSFNNQISHIKFDADNVQEENPDDEVVDPKSGGKECVAISIVDNLRSWYLILRKILLLTPLPQGREESGRA